MRVLETITNILNYYKNNPECDPNMYEFIGLCYDMVQYLNKEAPNHGINTFDQTTGRSTAENYPIPVLVYKKFEMLSEQVGQKLLANNLGITQESPLYKLYKGVSIGVGTYSAHGDTELLQKLGAVSLFIAQQKRSNPDFIYNNVSEFEYINELNDKLHDPYSGGYHVKAEGEKEWTYIKSDPSPRQQLLEEITNEFLKSKISMDKNGSEEAIKYQEYLLSLNIGTNKEKTL